MSFQKNGAQAEKYTAVAMERPAKAANSKEMEEAVLLNVQRWAREGLKMGVFVGLDLDAIKAELLLIYNDESKSGPLVGRNTKKDLAMLIIWIVRVGGAITPNRASRIDGGADFLAAANAYGLQDGVQNTRVVLPANALTISRIGAAMHSVIVTLIRDGSLGATPAADVPFTPVRAESPLFCSQFFPYAYDKDSDPFGIVETAYIEWALQHHRTVQKDPTITFNLGIYTSKRKQTAINQVFRATITKGVLNELVRNGWIPTSVYFDHWDDSYVTRLGNNVRTVVAKLKEAGVKPSPMDETGDTAPPKMGPKAAEAEEEAKEPGKKKGAGGGRNKTKKV